MKKYICITVILISMLIITGCGKKDEDEVSVTPSTKATEEAVEEPTEEAEDNVSDSDKSRLTGLPIDEELRTKRPFTVMFNNIKAAYPQSGTSEASILYEALVEGGITRLMGVFEDLHPDRIGSVRSGRQYFASITDEYDAILVSVGESAYCTEKIAELKLDQLSGLNKEGGTVFYRDSSIKAPHNAFASKEGVLEGLEMTGYEKEYDDSLNNHFTFYDKEIDLESNQIADKVNLIFSSYASPYFNYDGESKTYKRFQFDVGHIDANSGEQLEFKNIIVQFVNGFSIDETRTFSFRQGSGDGYYITNGKAIPITWDKNEANRSMTYYDSERDVLQMNPGKTYIAVFPGENTDNVIFE